MSECNCQLNHFGMEGVAIFRDLAGELCRLVKHHSIANNASVPPRPAMKAFCPGKSPRPGFMLK